MTTMQDSSSPTDLTLDALLQVLESGGLLSAEAKRDIPGKAATQSARVSKEHGKKYDVWASELIA